MALIALFAAFSGVALMVALRRPMLAVCAFLVVTLTNTPAILVHEHGFLSISTLLVPALAALLVIRTLTQRESPDLARLLGPFAGVLFLATALHLPWVESTQATASVVEELGKNLVIFLILVGFLTSHVRVHLAVRAVVAAIGSLALLSAFQAATGRYDLNFLGYANAAYLHIQGETQGWRLTGPLPDANFFAQLLLPALPLSVALIFVERHWAVRALTALFAIAILLAIVLTYSRGAMLALFVMALAALVLSRKGALVVPCVMIAAALMALFGPVATFERVFSGLETAKLLFQDSNINGDPAVIQRVSVMRAAARMFMENPILGIGPGQFSTLYPDYALRYALDMDAPAAAHNLFLEIAAEQGLVGLGLFVVFVLGPIALVARAVLRHGNVLPLRGFYLLRAILLGIIGYLAASLFLHDAYPRFFWVFMALLIATWGVTTAASVNAPPLSRSSSMPDNPLEPTESDQNRPFASGQTTALHALRQARVPIILGAIALGGLSAFQVAQTPTRYSTDAKLLYRFGREYFPITPTEVRRNWGENITVSLDNALATELHLLASHEVAAMTLKALEDPASALGLPPTAQTEIERTKALATMVNISRVQGTIMLGVRLTHTDPDVAERLLDTFIDAYLQRRDTLFHSDARAYYDSQTNALKAKDAATQDEIKRLGFERSEYESGADVTAWTPGAPRTLAAVDFSQIERQLLWIDGLIDQQQKLSNVYRTRLLDLERERQDWEMSRDYSRTVMPPVEIADRSPAAAVSTSARSIAQVVSAAIGGGLLVWLLASILHFWRRSRGSDLNADASVQ
ncbi:MAG: O-antigen ligase family protein [Paracoccaceae bacterium]